MKNKIFLLLVIYTLFSVLGCSSGPKSIRFNELSSKTFTLNNVFYMTIVDAADAEVNLSMLFNSLPIQAVIQQIETRYGIDVDVSLFSNINENISQIKSYDLMMKNYFLRFDTDENQRLSINFNKLDIDKYTVEVYLSILEDGKTTFRSNFITTVSIL